MKIWRFLYKGGKRLYAWSIKKENRKWVILFVVMGLIGSFFDSNGANTATKPVKTPPPAATSSPLASSTPKTETTPTATPKVADLDADIRFSSNALMVSNKESVDWKVCKVELNK